jgi:hypothetical protein
MFSKNLIKNTAESAFQEIQQQPEQQESKYAHCNLAYACYSSTSHNISSYHEGM